MPKNEYFCTLVMIVKTRAIVLHSLRYGDDKLIVDLFTESDGRVSFAVKAAKTKAARSRRLMFQPLTLLEVTFDMRRQLQMQQFKDVQFEQPLTSIPFSPVKQSLSLFLGEMLWHSLRGEQQNMVLFGYIRNSILWLDSADRGIANFHIAFLLRMPLFMGFMPNTDDYVRGMAFDLQEGCYVDAVPIHRHVLLGAESEALRSLLRMTLHNMHHFAMSRQQRARCLQVIIEYYRLHLPDFPEPKSLAILHDLWS